MEKINSNFVEKSLKYAKKFVEGLNRSISHFQAVEYSCELLQNAGFKQISESDNWKLQAGGKYFLTRNSSALIAFTVGAKTDINKTLFKIIGTHTDSPNLRLAPNSYKKSGNFERLHLQTYGGGQWQTWFDRDLSVCGKVVFKDNDNQLQHKLVRIDEPLFNIPHLAIHLTTDRNKPFDWNNENHLKLVLSMGINDILNESKEIKEITKEVKEVESDFDKRLGSKLSSLIAEKVGVDKSKLIDFDLVLYDTQPAAIIGINKEFVASGRLDNLGSTLVAVDSIIESLASIDSQESINVIAMFDNEEVGSQSYQGADSIVFSQTLERIFKTIDNCGTPEKDSFCSACSRSFAISADLAHATHPNYEEKHHSNHKVAMHQGVAIKINANQRYASESEGISILKDIAKNNSIPTQDFMVKQDSPCGTTIGPIISGNTGIKTIDIGVGCFAMHSIRETASSIDFYHYFTLMTSFLNDGRKSFAVNKII